MNQAIGLPLLYDFYGWYPGYLFDNKFEHFRGSDVAAHAFSFAHAGNIINDSIFKFGEFPFLNRYVGAGQSLWGQGYSMIGDPLHWITIIFPSSSVAWDVKFLLSKFLLIIGFGFLAFRLTNCKLTSITTSLIVSFIGFYTWVFNHPVFFSLTYVPFAFLNAISIKNLISKQSFYQSEYKFVSIYAILFCLIFWLNLNSTATKEAVINVLIIYSFIYIYLINNCLIMKENLYRKIIIVNFIFISAIVISLPMIFGFLNTIFNSAAATNYDIFKNDPYPLSLIIAFFEPLLFQFNFYSQGQFVGPSLNPFYLLFFISFLLIPKFDFLKKLLLVFILITLFFAFGLIPDFIVLNIPFINRIGHTGSTFLVPAISLFTVSMIYGIRNFYTNFNPKIFKLFWFIFIVFSINLFLSKYLYESFIIEIFSTLLIFVSCVFFYFYLYKYDGGIIKFKNSTSSYFVINSIILISLLTFKNGYHFFYTKPIDKFLINPNPRMDFHVTSESMVFLQNKVKNNPARVIGDGYNLMPGLNYIYRIEHILSAEAIKNNYLENFYQFMNIKSVEWGNWYRMFDHSINDPNFEKFLDIANVKFIASGKLFNKQNYSLIHKSDLYIYQRESAWPRAFFSSNIIFNTNMILNEKINNLKPFVLINNDEKKLTLKNFSNNLFIPAIDYKLSNNKTCFTVNAPQNGFIVINETFDTNKSFEVNNIPVYASRVNFWQSGIYIKNPGLKKVCSSYQIKYWDKIIFLVFMNIILILCIPLLFKIIDFFNLKKAGYEKNN